MSTYLIERCSGQESGQATELVILERFTLDGAPFAVVAPAPDFDGALAKGGIPKTAIGQVHGDDVTVLPRRDGIKLLALAKERGRREAPTIYHLDGQDGLGERDFVEVVVAEIDSDRDEDAWLVVLLEAASGEAFDTLIKGIDRDGAISFRSPEGDDGLPFLRLASQAKQIRDWANTALAGVPVAEAEPTRA
jgi:hypothetical protein